MSSWENILSFRIFFLNDSVTQIPGAKTSHHFIPTKAIKWVAKPYTNISVLSAVTLAFVPASGGAWED